MICQSSRTFNIEKRWAQGTHRKTKMTVWVQDQFCIMKIWRISNQYMYIELYRHRSFYFKILYTTYLFFFVCDGLYKWEVNRWKSEFFFLGEKINNFNKIDILTNNIHDTAFKILNCTLFIFVFLLLACLKSGYKAYLFLFYEGTNQHFFSLFFFFIIFLSRWIYCTSIYIV